MPGNEVAKVVHGAVAGGKEAAKGASRAVNNARERSGGGNPGLMRLVDVHASASAGDTLVAVGLLAVVFFGGTDGEARARVAWFLLFALAPFALVAPFIGPVLDRFRHGRRILLSVSLAGRAVLAWIISLYLDGGLWLYAAAFGVVLLSRSYAVARGSALARLAPPSGLRLPQAAARAAIFAVVAAIIAAGFGALVGVIGPEWTLRLSSLVFLVGAVIALTLPPLADAEPPEVEVQPIGVAWRHQAPGAGRRLVWVTLLGAGALRLLYGFLLVFLAFAIRETTFGDGGIGGAAGTTVQVILVVGFLGVGTLVATALGLRIHRRIPLQITGLLLLVLAGLVVVFQFSFFAILVLCTAVALATGLARVAVDAAIQERVAPADRPNVFARAETLLMLAGLAGAAVGLVPHVDRRLGVTIGGAVVVVAIIVSVWAAWRLRHVATPPTQAGGVVSGVLLQPGSYAESAPVVPPVPIAAVPYETPVPVAPPSPPAPPAPAYPPAPVYPPAPTPVSPAPAETTPPAFHVFQPSPPPPAPTPPTP